jgi:spore coat protein U-like protein
MPMSKVKVRETLVGMNWHFGKGDVHTVNHKAGTVTVKCPHAGSYTYKFRVVNGFVVYRGRKRKIVA